MNYQCHNPSCDNREAIGERAAKKHDHKCEDCGFALVLLVEIPVAGSATDVGHESAELRNLVGVLPTMLALPLAEYLAETRSILKLWGICEFAELSLRLLVIMGIADHRGQMPPALITALAERIERPTLGKWLGMAQAIASNVPASTLFPELGKTVHTLAEFLGDKRDEVQTAALPLRNLLAHGGVRRQQAEALIELWAPRMFEIAGAVSWLKTIDILGRNPDGNLTLMKGREPATAQRLDVAPEPAEALWLRRDGDVLGLWPLGRFAAAGADADPTSASTPQLYIRRGEVRLQYSNFGGVHPVGESGETALASFLNLFRTAACPAQEGGFSVRGFEAETRKEADRLIGRTEELAQLRSAVHAMQGGLLWLGGPAGMGKSCLVAALAGELLDSAPERALILIYRFRASDDRCSRDSFCRFAIERLQRWDGLQPDEKDLSETATALEQLKHCIARISEDHRVMFILDGLDEIAERDPRFHHEIPIALANTRAGFVCVGRLERNLPDAFRQAGAKEPFSDGLPPMRPADVRAMLMDLTDAPLRRRLVGRDKDAPDRVTNPFIDRVCELAEGMPLYVRYAAGDVIDGKLVPEAEGQLPAGLHKYHEELLRRCAVGDLQAVLTPLVVLLALAYEPLTVEQLAALLVRRGVLRDPDIRLISRALNGIASMVRRTLTPDGQEGFAVFHHSLSQHILKCAALAQTVAVTKTALADAALCSSGDGVEHYLYRCGIRHLLTDGRIAEALTLLTKFDHVMSRFHALGGGKEAVAAYYEDWSLVRAIGPLTGDPAIWWSFLRSNRHLLMRSDSNWGACQILMQLAAEHADDSPLSKAAEAWLAVPTSPKWLWLRLLRRPERSSETPTNTVVLEGHNGEIKGALELRDGRILSWSWDNTLRLWDAEGKPMSVLEGHSSYIQGACELMDGRIMSWDCGRAHNYKSEQATLRLWDKDGRALMCHRTSYVGAFAKVIELKDGRILTSEQEFAPKAEWEKKSQDDLLALAAENGVQTVEELLAKLVEANGIESFCEWVHMLRIRDANGEVLKAMSGSGSDGLLELNNGNILSDSGVVGESNGIWDREGNCIKELKGNIQSVVELDGGRIALVGYFDKWSGVQVLSCDGASVWASTEMTNPHALISLRGGWFLSMESYENTLHLWNPETRSFTDLVGHNNEGKGGLELRNGNILTWSNDGTIRQWDKSGRQLCVMEDPAAMAVKGVRELRDGSILSWSGLCVHLWSAAGNYVSMIGEHANYVEQALELTSGRILSWSDSDLIILDKTVGGRRESEISADKIKGAIRLRAGGYVSWAGCNLTIWSPDGKLCRTWVHDPDHGRGVVGALELENANVVAWSHSGYIDARGDKATIWDQTGAMVKNVEVSIWHELVAMGGGRIVASVRDAGRELIDPKLKLYDTEFRLIKELCPCGSDPVVLQLRSGRIVGSERPSLLHLWDCEGERVCTLAGHTDGIRGAIELHDGHILSWARDRTLRLWDNDGEEVAVLKGHQSSIDGATELWDGRILSWGEMKDALELRIWHGDGTLLESRMAGELELRSMSEEVFSIWKSKSIHHGPWDINEVALSLVFQWPLRVSIPRVQAVAANPLLLNATGVVAWSTGAKLLLTQLMFGDRAVTLHQAEGLFLSTSETLSRYRAASASAPDGDSCFSITPRLVRLEPLSAAQVGMVRNLDCYLRQATPTTEEWVVYRGCAKEELASLPEREYPSFLSASKRIEEAFGYVRGCLVRIICPPGTKLLQISPSQAQLSTLEHDEVLLPRNLHFRIEKWDAEFSEEQYLLLQVKQIGTFETWTLRIV